jgi:hypothetical protein
VIREQTAEHVWLIIRKKVKLPAGHVGLHGINSTYIILPPFFLLLALIFLIMFNYLSY